jgi:predicted ester cyclase
VRGCAVSDARAVVARFLEAYNAGEWAALDALVARGYVHHSGEQSLDLAGFKSGAAWIRRGLPDFRIECEDVVVENDRVAVRLTGRGTHSGSFGGERPTANAVVVRGIVLYRFADGVIAEDWEAMDGRPLLELAGG